MSWKEKIKEFGGADITFLSEDGEAIRFVVVADPILLEGKYKGKPSEKIGCPVVTEDGFVLFIAGKRLARKISKHESQFKNTCFMAVRHGADGDIDTTYSVAVLNDAEYTAKLLALAKADFKPSMIAEAVEAAKDVMNN